jgi:hypothetical protein
LELLPHLVLVLLYQLSTLLSLVAVVVAKVPAVVVELVVLGQVPLAKLLVVEHPRKYL